MSVTSVKTRLFVEQQLAKAQSVTLQPSQSHYLTRVMRVRAGGSVILFNGIDGEWLAEVRGGAVAAALTCKTRLRRQLPSPDIWLLFAPLRQRRSEYAVEKATELGVSRILPAVTERTGKRSLNAKRLRAVALEAAEQCGGMSVPEIDEPRPLAEILDAWPSGRRLFYCDEELPGDHGFPPVALKPGGAAVLIGPEGGLTPRERNCLETLEYATAAGLGERILRAETAVVAALAMVNIARR